MMQTVKYVDNHNGRFLVVSGDQWIRHGIEHVNLIGDELRRFDQLLAVAKSLRPFQKDVVDGGSNMGSWCIPLARKHSDLHFHMFEVQRFLYHVSCGNLALNHLLNVKANLMGLSSEDKMIELSVPDYSLQGNYGSFEVQTPFTNSDCVIVHTDLKDQVPVVRLDSLNLSPLLIKMDLEGMEWAAIQGAHHTIETYQPIVWCERQKSNPETILPWFEQRSYALSYAIENHWLFLPAWLKTIPSVAHILVS